MLNWEEYQFAAPEQWWQPGANTIAYYPLTSTTTTSDESGNGYNLTNAWEATFTTKDGISCMYCNWNVSGTGYVYTTALTTPPTDITINVRAKASNDWTWEYARWLFDTNFWYLPEGNNWIRWEFYSGNGYPSIAVGNWWDWTPWSYNEFNYIWVNYSAIQSRNMWTVTYDWENHDVAIYKNWILANSWTISSHIPTIWRTNNFTLWVGWRNHSVNRRWKWWISKTILESKARTATEISDYFDQTKSLYGIS